jgi:hypothetical protein
MTLGECASHVRGDFVCPISHVQFRSRHRVRSVEAVSGPRRLLGIERRDACRVIARSLLARGIESSLMRLCHVGHP